MINRSGSCSFQPEMAAQKIFSGDKTFLHFYHGDHQLLAASLGQAAYTAPSHRPKVQTISGVLCNLLLRERAEQQVDDV